MMQSGSLAVAMVQRQVMVVQASRSHSKQEAWIDVQTFTPFGDCVFLPSVYPQARIPASDILAVFSPCPAGNQPSEGGMLVLPPKAFSKFMELSTRTQEKYEHLFNMWSARTR
ncbi:hypothetical protein NM688_g8611 [Phlebia brevispora]|uniref:Uncharacterized protein n=1 Tax=Phlebia brevispora TaxID=194682 RepID=A0ACC1RSB9_9APHY|nr:hypothetical protein NM688_g8611 [Phlebia brevispora]